MKPIEFLGVVFSNVPESAYTSVLFLNRKGQNRIATKSYRITELYRLAEDVANSQVESFVRIAPMGMKPATGRGVEADSIGSSMLWVDIDCGRERQQEVIALLRQRTNPPTMIVNSGNGIHAYWRLESFCEDVTGIKQRNKALNEEFEDLGGDECFDLARVMRIPGTYNLKHEDPVECVIVECDLSRVYALNQFAVASLDPKHDRPFEFEDEEPIPDSFLEEIAKRDIHLFNRIFMETTAKVAGARLNEHGTAVDRSSNDAWIAKRLIELGYTAGQVMSVLTHETWFSGSKYRQTKRMDYIKRTAQYGIDHANQLDTTNRHWITEDELRTRPRPQMLIDNGLAKNEINLIYGQSGAGKTFFVLNEHVRPLLERGKTVVWIAAEDETGLSVRTDAVRKHFDLHTGTLIIWPEVINLCDICGINQFTIEILPLHPDLVVIDTLAQCMVGYDENSAKYMGIAIDNMKRIKNELSTTIEPIHHTGKNGDKERGSSALRGASYIITKIEQDSSGEITATNEKAKNCRLFNKTNWKLQDVELNEFVVDDTGEEKPVKSAVLVQRIYDTWEQVKKLNNNDVIVLRALAKGDKRHSQLITITGLGKPMLNEALNKLANLDYARKGESQRSPWSITQAGKDVLKDNIVE